MVGVFCFLYFPIVLSFNIRITLVFPLIAGLCLAAVDGFTQNGKFHIDSLFSSSVSDTLNVKQYTFKNWVYGEEGSYMLNAVHGTHNYHPLYENSQVRNDLGNLGSANHKVLFDFDQSFGFNFRNSRSAYWKPLEKRTFLLSEKMFSNVQYSNGVNRENYLLANFTRSFGKLLNLGFSFNRDVSEGFYARQRNVFTDMSVFTTFRSKDDRYKAALMFDYSNLRVEENGGITNDTLFEDNLTSGRSFIPTNLSQSSNHWKGFDLGLEHRFFLTKEDSLTRVKRYRPAISHSFSVANHSMIYRNVPDVASGFYENIFADTVATYDSTRVLSVINAFRFELVKSDSVTDKVVNTLAVGARHQFHRVSYDSVFVDGIHNVSVLGNVNGKLFGKVDWKAAGNFMVYGYNIWDLKIDGQFDYSTGESHFSAFVNYSLFRPDYVSDNYISNHFVWDNSWVQTQHLKTGFVYEQTKLRFKGTFTYHILDDLVAYGTDRSPYQSNKVNQLMVLRLQEHFRMRWFHVVLDGAVQFKLSGDDIRIPLALGRGMIYYQNDLFKKKLRLQIGAEVSYSMAYYANSYNPALSEFHIQNERQVGNYPFIDVFLNIRIKKLRAFFKVQHLNAGWLSYTYYHVPHYPVNDLAWKFGINWAFLD
jgi:hypothetical protein